MKIYRHFTALAVLGVLSLGAGAAEAHSTLEQSEANAGSRYKAIVRIPHGCGHKATTKVTIELPEGFLAAKPQAKAGWKIETVSGDYAKTYKLFGKDISAGVRMVVFSNGNLPSNHYDEFVVVGHLANFDKDTTLAFPVTQNCGKDASVAWTEVPQPGQNAHGLKNPAPTLLVRAAQEDHSHHHMHDETKHDDHSAHAGHGGAGHTAAGHEATHGNAMHADHQAAMPDMASVKAGDLQITAPLIRAMVPGSKVAGGFLTISNNGKDNDRLVGVTTDGVKQVEIHEMAMVDEVMKMRKLENGLAIPAGKTVELKPGGYHLMFIEPAKPYAEGDKVPVTLEFEKAGKVELAFPVGPRKGGH